MCGGEGMLTDIGLENDFFSVVVPTEWEVKISLALS